MKINPQVKSVLFEWLPYNQFNNIREVDKCDSIIHDQFNNIKNVGKNDLTVYLATWKGGPLKYNFHRKEWKRESDEKVILISLHNSQNIINEFLRKV